MELRRCERYVSFMPVQPTVKLFKARSRSRASGGDRMNEIIQQRMAELSEIGENNTDDWTGLRAVWKTLGCSQ